MRFSGRALGEEREGGGEGRRGRRGREGGERGREGEQGEKRCLVIYQRILVFRKPAGMREVKPGSMREYWDVSSVSRVLPGTRASLASRFHLRR